MIINSPGSICLSTSSSCTPFCSADPTTQCRTVTEGPEDTSRVVGRAQGFIIPAEQFARLGFNIVYLSFNTPEYSGSLGVQAKHITLGDTEELTVVAGMGAFAFAHGLAILAAKGGQSSHVVTILV